MTHSLATPGTWSLDANRVAIEWFKECGKPPSAALGKEVDRLSGLVGRPLEQVLTFV